MNSSQLKQKRLQHHKVGQTEQKEHLGTKDEPGHYE